MLAQVLVKIQSSENVSNAVKQEIINTMAYRNITDTRNMIDDIDLPLYVRNKESCFKCKENISGKRSYLLYNVSSRLVAYA